MVDERFETSRWVPRWIRHEHNERYRFAAAYVSGRVVVDCACGDGTGSSVFARAGASSVTGFDVSKVAIETARREHPSLSFLRASALALPIPDASADVFVSLETVEHIDSGERGAHAFVDEVARVLRPHGVFICSTPNRLVYNPGKPPDAKPWNRFHVREFAPDEFTSMLQRRFGEVRMYAQNPRARFTATALELIGRIPGHVAVRCSQAVKVLKVPLDRTTNHRVVPAQPGVAYEYLIAVSSGPTR